MANSSSALRYSAMMLTIALTLVLCLSLDRKPCFGQQNEKASNAESIEANNQATKEKLAKRIAADFENTPLADFFSFLSESLDVDVLAQRRDIEENAGVTLDTPITLKLKRVRGDMLLDLALKQVSPDVGFVVRDGIVIVSSKASLADQLTLRVYNCRDLLALPVAKTAAKSAVGEPAGGIAISEAAPAGAAAAASPMGGSSGMPPGMGSGMGGMGPGGTPRIRDAQAENLLQLIQSTVASGSWSNDGGTGAIDEFRGLIVVNHSEEVHDRIEKLLEMLRDAAKKQPLIGEK